MRFYIIICAVIAMQLNMVTISCENIVPINVINDNKNVSFENTTTYATTESFENTTTKKPDDASTTTTTEQNNDRDIVKKLTELHYLATVKQIF